MKMSDETDECFVPRVEEPNQELLYMLYNSTSDSAPYTNSTSSSKSNSTSYKSNYNISSNYSSND